MKESNNRKKSYRKRVNLVKIEKELVVLAQQIGFAIEEEERKGCKEEQEK